MPPSASRSPSPTGSSDGLANVVAEIEARMSGNSLHPRLTVGSALPDTGTTHVMVVFDGLGTNQLDHPNASTLAADTVTSVEASFPTTTTVSLATLVTGQTPAEHGLIGYMMWDPTAGTILNTIHMTSAWGDAVAIDLPGFLPAPNLFERLRATGVESIVVQPANFRASKLTAVLYRGARFEGYHSVDEAVDITLDVAAHPRRLIVLYVPHVDVAAHVSGQASAEYAAAMSVADTMWSRLTSRLGGDVALLATADHGHVDIAEEAKIRLTAHAERSARVWGDARAMYVSGDPSTVLAETGGAWVPRGDLEPLWGPGERSAATNARAPDGVILMPDGIAAYTRYMNDRLIGHHGGLTDAERMVPLLMRR